MTNKELVELFPKRKTWRARVESLRRQIAALDERRGRLLNDLCEVSDVTRIVDGVAIWSFGRGFEAVGDDTDRTGIFEKLQNAPGYGVETSTRHHENREVVTGLSKKAAREAALLWVTKGIRPVQK